MRVLILSGGRGERLRPLTDFHPKVLTSIHGKAFLYYLFKLYEKHDIVLSVGYMKEAVKKWCADNNYWPEYVEESKPLGHCGAILYAKPFLEHKNVFCVVNGDTLHNINLNSVNRGFSKNKNIALKVYAKNAISKKIEGCGIYIFKRECFKHFRKNLHTDQILKYIPTKKLYLENNIFVDIGTHKSLKFIKERRVGLLKRLS